MRNALLLLLLPLIAFSQAPKESPPSLEKAPTKRAIRIGLFSQFDTPQDNKYVYTVDGPLLRFQRSARPNLALDVQLIKNLPHFFLTASVGLHEISNAIDTMVQDERLTALNLGYFEDVEMTYWQMSLGFKMELFGQARFSPYVNPSFLFGLPSAMTYQITYLNVDDPNAAEFSVVEGGTLGSIGYLFQSGVRSRINERFSFNLGLYFANLSFDKDWPMIPMRQFGKGFLRLDNGGWELALHYRL